MYSIIQIALQLVTIVIGLYLAFGKSYFEEKGKNLATKEDIETITRKIEEVKAEIETKQEIEKQKRELKVQALLNSLNLIDAYLSNFILDDSIKKQYASTEEARACHNNLILTCDNKETIDCYEKIMMEKKPKDSSGTQYVIKELTTYRQLIRKELGYGENIHVNTDRVWIASVPFEKK